MDGGTPPILTYASECRRRDWRGWSVALTCGLAVGLLGGVAGLYDTLGGPIAAGVAMGIVSAFAARFRPLLLAVVSSVAVVAGVVVIIAAPHWYSGRKSLGTMLIDLRLLLGSAGLLLLVCVPAALAAVVTTYIKRRAA